MEAAAAGQRRPLRGAGSKMLARSSRRSTVVSAAAESPAGELVEELVATSPVATSPVEEITVEVATEPDYSFQDERMIPIDMFLKEWEIADNKVKEFAFDKDLPEEGAKTKENSLRNSLYAMAMAALTQVTTVLDECIQGDKVTKSGKEPVVEVYAYPGHHEQRANRF